MIVFCSPVKTRFKTLCEQPQTMGTNITALIKNNVMTDLYLETRLIN